MLGFEVFACHWRHFELQYPTGMGSLLYNIGLSLYSSQARTRTYLSTTTMSNNAMPPSIPQLGRASPQDLKVTRRGDDFESLEEKGLKVWLAPRKQGVHPAMLVSLSPPSFPGDPTEGVLRGETPPPPRLDIGFHSHVPTGSGFSTPRAEGTRSLLLFTPQSDGLRRIKLRPRVCPRDDYCTQHRELHG